ncbi:MAG: extracellular solute-binding protein [Lacrimispora sp.]|uniref:ABC transporter substrate-binding protein n=1 Tax=Lacrimispora sp. TaxID=2719234 RepID=UPI0039E50960
MKKRIGAIALSLGLVCSLLAGCGNGGQTSDKPAGEAAATKAGETAGAAGGQVTLELYLQKTNVVDVFKEIITRFEAQNPEIKIELTSVPDPETALVTRIASNDYPDIVTIWPAEKFYRDLMRDGALMDISDQAFLNDIADETREIAKYDGKDYALSMTMSAYGLIVNNKLFEENGIEKPQTWDELIAAAEAFQAKGIQPFAFYDKSTEQLGQMAERLIGVINNDITSQFKKVGKSETAWENEKEMKALADAMLQLRQYGQKDTLGAGYEDAFNDIATEKAAMIFYGSWGIQTILNLNPDLDIEMITIPNPTGELAKVPASIDTALSITESCENKEAALKFLAFMGSKEIAQYYADTEQNPSVIKTVDYKRPQLQTMSEKLKSGDMFFSPSVYWPAGFRKSWEAPLQQLILSKDVNAFLKDSDSISVEYFQNEE